MIIKKLNVVKSNLNLVIFSQQLSQRIYKIRIYSFGTLYFLFYFIYN